MEAATDEAWQKVVYDSLRKNGVNIFTYVPDAGHRMAIDLSLADPEVKSVALTTEEEGVAVAAGAHLGGAKAALLMQSSGLGNCINFFSMITGGKFPTGPTPNGDNASTPNGGTFRFVSDDPVVWSRPLAECWSYLRGPSLRCDGVMCERRRSSRGPSRRSALKVSECQSCFGGPSGLVSPRHPGAGGVLAGRHAAGHGVRVPRER